MLTSPMYLMVARSFSPTRIRVPTSKSLTSIRLFMRLQQCVQRPTMLKLRKKVCNSTVNPAAACTVVAAVTVLFSSVIFHNQIRIAPIYIRFFLSFFFNICASAYSILTWKLFKLRLNRSLWISNASLVICDVSACVC